MRHILITGSNRGIGLAMVREYLKQDDTWLFATCRQPEAAAELNELAAQFPNRVTVIPLDVSQQHSIDDSVRAVRKHTDRLDMLVNNAGILPGGIANRDPNMSAFGQLDAEAMLHVLHINTVAPVIVAQAYADLLRAGDQPRLLNMSSDAGSIAGRDQGCDFSYPGSKAALNMMTRCLAGDFRGAGVVVVSMHPGFLRTDMGGPNAHMDVDETIPTLVRVIDGLTMADSGQFFNWDGATVPW